MKDQWLQRFSCSICYSFTKVSIFWDGSIYDQSSVVATVVVILPRLHPITNVQQVSKVPPSLPPWKSKFVLYQYMISDTMLVTIKSKLAKFLQLSNHIINHEHYKQAASILSLSRKSNLIDETNMGLNLVVQYTKVQELTPYHSCILEITTSSLTVVSKMFCLKQV